MRYLSSKELTCAIKKSNSVQVEVGFVMVNITKKEALNIADKVTRANCYTGNESLVIVSLHVD